MWMISWGSNSTYLQIYFAKPSLNPSLVLDLMLGREERTNTGKPYPGVNDQVRI
jgi:hypothetical protein